MKFFFILFLLLLLQLPKTVVGQENSVFWNYDISHGLLTNSNYSLMIDHHGRLWFGSDKGVTCYNGSKFKTYTVSDGLSDNTVIRCFEDSKGRIWFLHVNRLPSYLYKNKIHRLNSNNDEVSIVQTSELIELDSNTFLIGGKHGFYKINVGGKIQKLTDKPGHNSITHALKNGQLIVTRHTNKKLLQFQSNIINLNELVPFFTGYTIIETGTFFRSFDYFYSNGIINTNALKKWENPVKDPSAFIYEIIQKNDKLFVSTSKGLKVYTKNNNSWVEKQSLLPNVQVISIRHDKEGNMWLISMNNGLYFFPKLKFSFYECPIKNELFTSINKSNNRIFLGTNTSKVLVFDGTNFSPFKDYKKYADLPINITSFHQINGYDIVNANAGTYLEKNGRVSTIGGSYESVHYRDSNYILGPSLYGIQKIDFNQNRPTRQMLHRKLGRVRKLVLMPDHLIAGCQNGIWEIKNDLLKPLDGGKLAMARINGLEMLKGRLLVGTGNQGLWIYEGKKLLKYQPASSILSESISDMYPGENNTIWIHTSAGLQHFKWTGNKLIELHRLDLKTYFKSDELIGLLESKGHLILLINSGLIDLELKNIPPIQKIKLFIDRFEINDLPFSLNQKQSLPRNSNNLFFELGTANYSAHPIVYYYRINNGKWIKNGSEIFSFSSLHPGSYDIEFKAKSPFYEAAFLKTPTLTIQKKWWQKTVYVVVVLFVLALLIFFLIFFRVATLQNRKQRFLSIELMALQSQMNPHFTFNSLNSIQSYLSNNDKRSAQIYLADFAILIRKILEQGKLHLISIAEEIEFLDQYLKLEKRRLNDSFDFSFHLSEEIDTLQLAIPTLMLQPFVENAIWHGVAGLEYKGKIDISLRFQSDSLICEIRDNGPGWGKSSNKTPDNKSTGIENCRERMELFKELYKKELLLEIVDRNGFESNGVSIRMTIPKLTIQS